MDRLCIRCKRFKDEAEFNWRDIEKGYLQSVCKPCQAEDSRKRYRENPELVKEINRSARLKMIDEAKQYVYVYLLSSKCADCGETDFTVLTFHHTDPLNKRMNIGDMVAQGYATSTIQRELERCIVLCASCHMRKEGEKKGGRFRKFWGI
jgi:predicted Fe-S protein YdhL (DUF1289 family)